MGFQLYFHTGLFVHVKIGSFPSNLLKAAPGRRNLSGTTRVSRSRPLQEEHLVFIQSLDIKWYLASSEGNVSVPGEQLPPRPLPGSQRTTIPSLKPCCLQGDRGIIRAFSKAGLVPGSAIPGELVPSLRRPGPEPRDIPLPDVMAGAAPEPLLLATSP